MTQTQHQSISIEELVPYDKLDENHHEKVHIVNPPSNMHIWRPGMTTQEIVTMARILRVELTALCGHRFIPQFNPEQISETCQPCLDEAARLMKENNE